MNTQQALTALAEPTRFRIVELLAAAPRTVGEVADELGVRQPQTTKHLQALAAAELIIVHRLGRRRVAALRRDALRELAGWFDTVATDHPDESALAEYQAAVDAEEARTATGAPGDRTILLHRALPASPEGVWPWWTDPDRACRWWVPEHFDVADCGVVPEVGGTVRLVLREGDGAEYTSIGTFLALEPPRELRFEMSPLGADGSPLFEATFSVSLVADGESTDVIVSIDIADVVPDAAAAVAGVEIGWRHNLDRLAAHLA